MRAPQSSDIRDMSSTRSLHPELIKKTKEFLGKDGLKFFKETVEKHGRVDAVYLEGRLPHAVHFQEGMQIRNFMRGSGFCDGWHAHDLDEYWVPLIKSVIA